MSACTTCDCRGVIIPKECKDCRGSGFIKDYILCKSPYCVKIFYPNFFNLQVKKEYQCNGICNHGTIANDIKCFNCDGSGLFIDCPFCINETTFCKKCKNQRKLTKITDCYCDEGVKN